jgi:hypothetical protein
MLQKKRVNDRGKTLYAAVLYGTNFLDLRANFQAWIIGSGISSFGRLYAQAIWVT